LHYPFPDQPHGFLPIVRSKQSLDSVSSRTARSKSAWSKAQKVRKEFDVPTARSLLSGDTFGGGKMDSSGGDSQGQPAQPQAPPRFPRIWVGYLLGAATIIAEMIAISLHPELAKEPLIVPPLYLFLANFISLVYWLVCVYEFHVLLVQASSGTYSIKPLRAAWFHLIPIYGLYWVYKWPRELARFVNSRLPAPLMRPERTGFAILLAFIVFLLLDRGFGMILLFWAASHLSRCLRLALAVDPGPRQGPLPFS